jgi:hypothetical protein|tara:strand:+ start:866 stop:1594 length:729 start_codon:yes stop_codon:yes gene_type:complete
MALPILAVPKHELNIPSTNEVVKYRPFLVKEEKVLLMAQESNEEKTIIDAMKEIVKNCVETKLDIDKMPLFDIEYIFMKLRAKSVGEIVKLKYGHPGATNSSNEKCEHFEEIEVNLDKVEVSRTEGHDTKVKLTDDIGLVMRYPQIGMMEKVRAAETEVETLFDVIRGCIEMIYEGDEVHYPKDYSKKEMETFLESLNTDQFVKIRNFFETMPKIRYETEYECTECNQREKVTITNIQDFFE